MELSQRLARVTLSYRGGRTVIFEGDDLDVWETQYNEMAAAYVNALRQQQALAQALAQRQASTQVDDTPANVTALADYLKQSGE